MVYLLISLGVLGAPIIDQQKSLLISNVLLLDRTHQSFKIIGYCYGHICPRHICSSKIGQIHLLIIWLYPIFLSPEFSGAINSVGLKCFGTQNFCLHYKLLRTFFLFKIFFWHKMFVGICFFHTNHIHFLYNWDLFKFWT